MDLFKRFPKIILPGNEQDLIPENQKSNFADFAADFAILERELMPTYRELDREATRRQNSYRWMYVILIFGGSLATILGIIQLTVDGDWVSIAGAVVASLLGITTLSARSFNHQARFLEARRAAELLRTEYFFFLGRFGPYDDEQEREMMLIQRVTEIKIGGDNHGEG